MEFRFNNSMPIWQQLANQITESIVTGEYPPGEKFPSVRELALQADVNPNTMQRALAKLEEQGLLLTARTAGRTVTEDQKILQETRRMENGGLYGRNEKTRLQPGRSCCLGSRL